MITQSRFFFVTLGLCLSFSNFLWADTVTVVCPHKSISFTAEVPLSAAEREKGLMFRETLADNAGMLFFFPNSEIYSPSMWMKNTPLSLDMIFANETGAILEIFENTAPYSEARIGPVPGTTQVFEINGGLSKKHSITKACFLKTE
jgi:uncharacterized membrane protein (UPF0127 family)